MCVYIYMCVFVCVCMFVSVCVYVRVSVSVWPRRARWRARARALVRRGPCAAGHAAQAAHCRGQAGCRLRPRSPPGNWRNLQSMPSEIQELVTGHTPPANRGPTRRGLTGGGLPGGTQQGQRMRRQLQPCHQTKPEDQPAGCDPTMRSGDAIRRVGGAPGYHRLCQPDFLAELVDENRANMQHHQKDQDLNALVGKIRNITLWQVPKRTIQFVTQRGSMLPSWTNRRSAKCRNHL